MAGNIQTRNVQRNLEQKIGGSRFLDRMKKVGTGISHRLGSVKKYTTIAIAAAGLALGGSYVGGCDYGEGDGCCSELNCEDNYTSMNPERGECRDASPHNADKCITNDEGVQECCSCVYIPIPDYNDY